MTYPSIDDGWWWYDDSIGPYYGWPVELHSPHDQPVVRRANELHVVLGVWRWEPVTRW